MSGISTKKKNLNSDFLAENKRDITRLNWTEQTREEGEGLLRLVHLSSRCKQIRRPHFMSSYLSSVSGHPIRISISQWIIIAYLIIFWFLSIIMKIIKRDFCWYNSVKKTKCIVFILIYCNVQYTLHIN